jgi:hypothetical protein
MSSKLQFGGQGLESYRFRVRCRDHQPHTDDVARALAAAVIHVPQDRIADWFGLVEHRVTPAIWARERALIWAFAHSRWQAADHVDACEIIHQWMFRGNADKWTVFDKPWQVLLDFAGYGPALIKVGGPSTGERLCELLGSTGFLPED